MGHLAYFCVTFKYFHHSILAYCAVKIVATRLHSKIPVIGRFLPIFAITLSVAWVSMIFQYLHTANICIYSECGFPWLLLSPYFNIYTRVLVHILAPLWCSPLTMSTVHTFLCTSCLS